MILEIIALVVIVSYLWWYLQIRKFKALEAVPGPTPIPFFGNAFQLGSTPQALLKNLYELNKKYGSIFRTYIGSEVRVYVTDAEIIKELLSSSEHIVKTNAYDILAKWLGNGLLISRGAKWISRRKLITPTFHFKILDNFMKSFNSCTNTFIEKMLAIEGPVDINPYINLLSLDIICETAMGVKIGGQEGHNQKYVTAVKDFLSIFIVRIFSAWKKSDSLFRFSPDFAKEKQSLNILHSFSKNIIQQRRKNKNDIKNSSSLNKGKKSAALLDMLLDSEDAYLLSDEDIREEIDTFMFAGHDTTTAALSFAVLNLANHLSIQEALYEEIMAVVGADHKITFTINQLQELTYLDMFIKESQRLYSTVPNFERLIEKDTIIGGYNIPKGTMLNCFCYGLHLNSNYYTNPEDFNPDRFLPNERSERHKFAYVPFSAGPRNCIGQRFALLEIKTTLTKIIQTFRVLPVANFTPDLGMTAILKSYNGIMIQLEKRKNTL